MDAKRRRFMEISISAFETLQAPRVGVAPEADAWARDQHTRQNESTPLNEWLEKLKGLYVVSVVQPCDGVPRYSNGSVAGYVEPFSFRAQFLTDCTAIIGADCLERAYQSQLPPPLLEYGRTLLAKAETFARAHGFDLGALNIDDVDSVESQLDAVICAGRWCIFWAERGHPLEAYW
jgi:hypothetical protein